MYPFEESPQIAMKPPSESTKKKGLELEHAVESIEKMIHSVRKIPPQCINLERQKIINHVGVRHEIDLFVQVKFGDGYDATYIFEAKNWRDPVGKSEMIDFIEKMRVTAAQAGFFYAPSFTSCAEAQSQLYPNITLVKVKVESDCPSACLPLVETCSYRIHAISLNSEKEWMCPTDAIIKEFRSEDDNFNMPGILKFAQSRIVDGFQKEVGERYREIGPTAIIEGAFDLEGKPVFWRDEEVRTVRLKIFVEFKTIGTSCSVSYTAEGRGRHIHLNDVRISERKILTNIRATMQG